MITTKSESRIKLFDFDQWRQFVLSLLTNQSSPMLTYHTAEHTADVIEQCERIAAAEGIKDEEQLLPLKIAALYHDTGFLYTYQDHEHKSCEIVREQLKDEGLSAETLDLICSLIMVTKLPQEPKTHLEQIICDADLDYLGRDDFEGISDSLRKEFLAYGFVQNDQEWNEVQIRFIEHHQYFTQTSKHTRSSKKEKQLQKLKLEVAAIINK